jgi:two-component system response regulator MprA
MRRVLVVEDDADIRQLLVEILGDEGYAVALAADGVEAIEQVAAARPALLVLDLMLPRLNGDEVLAELERRGLRTGLPVLVLTAAGPIEERVAGLAAEAFLAKPFTIDEFVSVVQKLAGTPGCDP